MPRGNAARQAAHCPGCDKFRPKQDLPGALGGKLLWRLPVFPYGGANPPTAGTEVASREKDQSGSGAVLLRAVQLKLRPAVDLSHDRSLLTFVFVSRYMILLPILTNDKL